jgi:hypothetical protein
MSAETRQIRFRWSKPERLASGLTPIGWSTAEGMQSWLDRDVHFHCIEAGCAHEYNTFIEVVDGEVWVCAEVLPEVFDRMARVYG